MTESVVLVLNDRGTVRLDPASMLVCKQFHGPDAAELARREFDYLQRFSTALVEQPSLCCPKPVRVEPEQGKLWMTYCPGTQLHHAAEESGGPLDSDLEHIAEQIANAIESYVTEFNEPYYDLAAWNMLYDSSTRTLAMIDFAGGGRDRLSRPGPRQAPVDVSLGCLIGTTVYHTVRLRRSSWRKQDYWKRQERLTVAVLARLSAHHDLRPSHIRRVSHIVYDSLGKRRGKPLRRFWFWTAGQALFNRRSNAIVATVRTRNNA